MKTEYINIRVTPEEKKRLKELSTDQGFDNLTVFILWLIRNHFRSTSSN